MILVGWCCEFSPACALERGHRDVTLLIPVPLDPCGTSVHKGSIPRPGYGALTRLYNGDRQPQLSTAFSTFCTLLLSIKRKLEGSTLGIFTSFGCK